MKLQTILLLLGLFLTSFLSQAQIENVLVEKYYISDDFDAVLGVFKQLKTKSQVSYLAHKFNEIKGKDLLNWLQGGGALSWPADRFSAEQVNQLIKYVNGLKNY